MRRPLTVFLIAAGLLAGHAAVATEELAATKPIESRAASLGTKLAEGDISLSEVLELQRLLLGRDLRSLGKDNSSSSAEASGVATNWLFPASDFDGNGKGDLINFSYPDQANPTSQVLEARRGSDASILWSIPVEFTSDKSWTFGEDLTGDGVADLVEATTKERASSWDLIVQSRSHRQIDLELVVHSGADGRVAWTKVIQQSFVTEERRDFGLRGLGILGESESVQSFRNLVTGMEEISSQLPGAIRGGALLTTSDGEVVAKRSNGYTSWTRWAYSVAHILDGVDGREIRAVKSAITNNGWSPSFLAWRDVDGDGGPEILEFLHSGDRNISNIAMRTIEGESLWSTDHSIYGFFSLVPAPLRSSSTSDLLITRPFNVSKSQSYTETTAIDGSTGSVLWRHDRSWSANLIEDADHDGDAEIVETVRIENGLAVNVLDGSSGTTLWSRVLTNGDSPPGPYNFIDCECGVGDLSGDGVSDQLIYFRSYDYDNNLVEAHAESVSGADGTTIWVTNSTSQESELPKAFMSYDAWDWDQPQQHGDANGNGTGDIYIGTTTVTDSGLSSFTASLFDGSDLSSVWTIPPSPPNSDASYFLYALDVAASSSSEAILIEVYYSGSSTLATTSAYSSEGRLWEL